MLTKERIVAAIEATEGTLRRAGVAQPRIAVAGLNPHAGEGGVFGREEIDVIAPAVEAAAKKGFVVEGPFPADTVWLRARRGDYDVVLSMYHDQGQIALKLLGFERGVTILVACRSRSPRRRTAPPTTSRARASRTRRRRSRRFVHW
jgi:4-hydroxythreonine-4-phosphate dehydrogenase